MKKNEFIVNIEGCILHRNKILMILRGNTKSHAPNTIAFPGGQVEYRDSNADTLEDTLRREIYEEVGLKITEGFEYLESKKFVTKKGNNVLDVVMFCRMKDVVDFKIDNREVDSCMWMDIDEILSNVRTPDWIKQSIKLVEKELNL